MLNTEFDLVDFTLWRGDVRLGRVRIPFPVGSPGALAGMLEVEPAFADLDVMMQTWIRMLPGCPVFEFKMKEALTGRALTALRELSPDGAAGIPASRVLEIRDADGRALPVELVQIYRLPAALMLRGALAEICGARNIAISPWSLSARFTDPADGIF